MKIAIASCGLGHITRGIEAWAHDLAHALADRGEHVILCKGGGSADAEFERVIPCWQRESGRTIKWLNRLPKRGLWRLGLGSTYEIESMTFAWNLLPVLRRESIDILHVQDPLVALIVQRARKLRLVRTKPILGHGTNESFVFLKKIEFLQHLSPFSQRQIADAGLSKPTWTTIPNFIDTDTFHPGRSDEMRDELGIPRDAVVVLTAAAIKREHKRIDFLLDEFARARAIDPALPIYLIVAGGAEADTESLIAKGRELLGQRFIPLVRFPRARMAALYRAADLFVLASLREMMPIALLEATASGLPCIVNDHASLDWIVGKGGRGIDMAADGALAQEICALAANTEIRAALSDHARQHCLSHFRRDIIVNQILSFYRRVLGEESPNCIDAAPSPNPAV